MNKVYKLIFVFTAVLVCASAAIAQNKILAVAEVQGEKQISPYNGKIVTVRGIVTARVKNGFYIQTPDGQDDKNSKTSEGILIFTGGKEPRAEAVLGNLVEVTGIIDEYRPKVEPVSLPITEIRAVNPADEIKVISKNEPLPKPLVLTAVDLNSQGGIDQLERYEGMRLKITSLTVTAPTNGRVDEKTATAVSDGVFWGVLTGTPRPFREPGVEPYESMAMKTPAAIPVFDGNPELLRVDSNAQIGAAAIEVTSNATIKNLVGVLDYAFRAYTLLVDANSAPTISGSMTAVAVPAAKAGEFTVCSMNVERFFDDSDDSAIKEPILTKDAFQNRLKKASLVIRDYARTPDVLALIEMENLPTLQKLADRINADALAAGNNNLKYEAFLFEGNDFGGIDSGFLVNTRRVSVVKVEQLAKDEKFKRPSDGKETATFDRPPIVLQASIKEGEKTWAFTVVANHLKSLLGVFNADGDTRMKKKLQSEYLARFAQSQQNTPLIMIGDFNAFQFSDGLVDVIGTIEGKPAPKEKVLLATESAVNPPLTDLVDMIPREQKYSYSFAGNAQVIDHFLINDLARKHAARFGFTRVNTDFPESLRSDATRPERLSDHDAPVGYFTIDVVQK